MAVKQKKKSIFAPIVIIVYTVIFVGMAFVWEYLYRYLEAYEKNVPSHAANEIVELYKEKNFSEILRLQGIETDEFNTLDEYTEYIYSVYGEDFSDARALKTANSGDSVIYSVYCKNERLCDLTLTHDGEPDSFGFRDWSVAMGEAKYPKNNYFKAYVPRGAQVFLNGELLDEKNILKENHGIHGYDEVYDENLRPRFDVYEVKELLNKPEIKVLDGNNAEMTLTVNDKAYYALPNVSPEMRTLAQKLSEEIGVKYALYSITDLKFDDISPYLFKDSEYYKTVKSFYNEWYKEHTFTYDNVKFSEMTVYDDTHFSIKIDFTYHINIGWRTNDYDVSYNMFFIYYEGQWLLCGMEL